MSREVCAIDGCPNKRSNTKSQQIKFYRFPKNKNDEEISRTREEWIKRCNKPATWNPCSFIICSVHFRDDDFIRDLEHELLNLPPRKRLNPTAVPSLNLPESVQELIRVETALKEAELEKESEIVNDDPVMETMELGFCNFRKKKKASTNSPEKLQKVVETRKAPELDLKSKKMIKKKPVKRPLAGKDVVLPSSNSNIEINSAKKICKPTVVTAKQTPIENQTNTEATPETEETVETTTNPDENNCRRTELTLQEKYYDLKDKYRQLKKVNDILIDKVAQLSVNEDRFGKRSNSMPPVRELLRKHFTENQIDIILNCKTRAIWTKEEMLNASILYYFSSKGYLYLRDKLNYPFPSGSSVRKWINKKPKVISDIEGLNVDEPIDMGGDDDDDDADDADDDLLDL